MKKNFFNLFYCALPTLEHYRDYSETLVYKRLIYIRDPVSTLTCKHKKKTALL